MNECKIVIEHGTKFWYLNDVLHREDGPAIEHATGGKFWYRNGKLHREDGPACKHSDGTKLWYLNGVRYSKKKFDVEMDRCKKLTVKEIEKLLGYSIIIVG